MRQSACCKAVVGLVSVAVAVLLVLGGCSPQSKPKPAEPEPEPIDADATDQMFTEPAAGEVFDVVVFGDKAVRVSNGETIGVYDPTMQDGHFYRVTADVVYLNGGIAGYYNYPDIQDVTSVREVKADELDIPSLEQQRFGFVRIGDYADGDYLYTSYKDAAVLKDGKWVYTYTKEYDRPDGSNVRCVADIDKERVEDGIASGVVCCEDYFLIPAR